MGGAFSEMPPWVGSACCWQSLCLDGGRAFLKIDPSWLKARVVGCRCVLDGGASFKTAPPSDSIRCWLSLWGRRGSIGCRCGVEERAFSGTVHPLLVGSMQHVLLAVAVGSTWRALFKDRPWLKARVVGCRYMVDKDAFFKTVPLVGSSCS